MPGTEYGLNELFLPEPDSGKRRSTRIAHAAQITVHGTDALGETFIEQTKTVTVSCHGCKFHSSHYVPKHSSLTLEIPCSEGESCPRVILGKVVWVQKPRSVRELVQIALAFDVPGNYWRIELAPQDWLPLPVEEKVALAALLYDPSAPKPIEPTVTLAPVFDRAPVVEAVSSPSRNIPSGQSFLLQSREIATAGHVSKMVAETRKALDDSLRAGVQTTTDELMRIVGRQVDLQLRPAVEKEVTSLMERISAPAGNEAFARVADLLAAVEQEVCKACEAIAGSLDAPVNPSESPRPQKPRHRKQPVKKTKESLRKR